MAVESITIDTHRGWDIFVSDPQFTRFGAWRRDEGPGLRRIEGTWPTWEEARRALKKEIDRLFPPLPLFEGEAINSSGDQQCGS